MDVTESNQKAWNRVALDQEVWFTTASEKEIADAKEGKPRIILTATKSAPLEWLGDLKDKKVLCLAGGGGQQSPILAAAGADVAVVDFSEKQLEKDRNVAEQFGLELRTIQNDMRDLSAFESHTFDLIVNPCSVNYCDSVQLMWNECFRVLKTGGALVAGMINPINYLFDPLQADKGQLVVKNKLPHADSSLPKETQTQLLGENRPLEFGHTLSTLLGGQIQAGLVITDFYEDRWGQGDELSKYLDVFIATRSIKPV